MRQTSRRSVLGGAVALIITAVHSALVGPAPVRAGRPKSVKFDITASQFRDDCQLAGGEFADWGGEYTCYMDGWQMTCSKATGRCRITCDPGVTCVHAKRLAGSVRSALAQGLDQITPVAASG